MGRMKTRSDYESIRNSRIHQNQARLVSMEEQKAALSDLRSAESERKYQKLDCGFNPLRRSPRLNQMSPHYRGNAGLLGENKEEEKRSVNSSRNRQKALCCEEDSKQSGDLTTDEPCRGAGEIKRLKTQNDYESIRNARIQENQARMASLGVRQALSDLRANVSSAKPVRKYQKIDHGLSPLRRSSRLSQITPSHKGKLELFGTEEEDKRPANAPLLGFMEIRKPDVLPEVVARRCSSKSRGTVYHPVFGICCHFCRQKTLCVEEDCKRCGDLDMDQPCIGKTDCSVCHSSNGVLCRACLKVRYGEEMEEVRENKGWMCPHCIEEKGMNPYWICNSSFCLKKRKLTPTGIAIFKAREMGYKSVAHLLMDQLQQAECRSI